MGILIVQRVNASTCTVTRQCSEGTNSSRPAGTTDRGTPAALAPAADPLGPIYFIEVEGEEGNAVQ